MALVRQAFLVTACMHGYHAIYHLLTLASSWRGDDPEQHAQLPTRCASVHAAAALKDENASFGIWDFMTRTVVTSGLKRMLSQTLGEAGSFLLFSWPCRV